MGGKSQNMSHYLMVLAISLLFGVFTVFFLTVIFGRKGVLDPVTGHVHIVTLIVALLWAYPLSFLFRLLTPKSIKKNVRRPAELLKKVVKPKYDPYKELKNAERKIADKEYSQALTIIESVIEKEPTLPHAFGLKGAVKYLQYKESNNADLAKETIDYLEKAISLHISTNEKLPKEGEYYIVLGDLYFKQGDKDKALNVYECAVNDLDLSPDMRQEVRKRYKKIKDAL